MNHEFWARNQSSDQHKTSDFMKYFSYLYIVGGLLSMITNLNRADPNLILFAYMYVATRYMSQLKVNGIYLILFSLFIDVFWIIFIHVKILMSTEFTSLAPWQTSLELWAFWCLIANMGIKGVIVGFLMFCDKNK